ncbi:MAG: hypothetical protein AB7F40_09475 [Victivallaceae bacterium]|nr:hypothetical protein [Victivallaceae bacterium]
MISRCFHAALIAALGCGLAGCLPEPSAEAAKPVRPGSGLELPESEPAVESVPEPEQPVVEATPASEEISDLRPSVWRIEPAPFSRLNYLTLLSCVRLDSAPAGEYPSGGLSGIVHHEFEDDGGDAAAVAITPNGTGFACAVTGADPERCYVAELAATLTLSDKAARSFVFLAEENAVFKLFVNGNLVLTCDPSLASDGQSGLRESAVFELKPGENELRMRLVLPSGGPVAVRLLLRGRGEFGSFILRRAE